MNRARVAHPRVLGLQVPNSAPAGEAGLAEKRQGKGVGGENGREGGQTFPLSCTVAAGRGGVEVESLEPVSGDVSVTTGCLGPAKVTVDNSLEQFPNRSTEESEQVWAGLSGPIFWLRAA